MHIKINKLSAKILGETVKLKIIIVHIKSLAKKDSSKYISVKVQDNSGSMEFPVWDIETQAAMLTSHYEGKVFELTGHVSFYEGKAQIKDPSFLLLKDEDVKSCLPKYDITPELLEYFHKTIDGLSIKYKSFLTITFNDALLSQFLEAPAAQSHHHAKIGGLFVHTVGVMKNVDSMISNYVTESYFLVDASSKIDKDRLMFKAILHDLGKIWEYEWDSGIRRRDFRIGHIIKTCSYIENANNNLGIFSLEEIDDICSSILCHHGNFEKYGKVEIKTVEDQLLHLADMIDSQIVGHVEGGGGVTVRENL